MKTTTWRKEIGNETLADIVAWQTNAPDGWLDVSFENNYGSYSGPQFTFWTASRVYSVDDADGMACIVSLPRNPN